LDSILRFFQPYRWLDLPGMVGIALLYALLAKIVLTYFSEAGNATLVWFPGGFGLAVLLLRGRLYWPAIFAGAFAAGLMVDDPIPASLQIALGNTLESVTVAWLLERNSRFSISLIQPEDFIYLALTGAAGALISAALGPSSLWLAGILPGDAMPPVMLRWWMSDTFGIITLTPIILTWRHWPETWFTGKHGLEALLLAGLTLLVGLAVFMDAFSPWFGMVARGYWMFLFIIWAAIRFGRHGVMLVIGIVTTLALFGAASHQGFFGDDFQKTGLLNLWLYISVLSWVGTILALTLHKNRRITLNLQESENRLQAIIDASPVPYALIDDREHVILLNPAFIACFGYTLADIPNLGAWRLKAYPDPEYRQWVMSTWQARLDNALRNNSGFEALEVEIRCKNADARTALVSTASLGESFVGTHLVILYDITARVNSAKQVVESHTLLQNIIETLPVRVFWKDRQLQYLGCNALFAQDAGLSSSADLIGKDDTQLTWREQAAQYQADDRKVIASGHAKLAYEEPQTTPSGGTIWLRSSKLPLLNASRQTIGILGVYEDITQNKLNEQTLAESVSLLQATLEATADGILVVNLKGRIRSFNQRFLELWSLPEALIGQIDDDQKLLDLAIEQLKNPNQFLEKVQELYAHPEMESYDLIEFNDGKIFERYSLPQRIDNEIIGRVWSFRNITERRQIEQQLLWRTAFLEALLESSPDGIITVDSEGNKIQQNRRAVQMWNIPSDIAEQPEYAKQIEFIKSYTKYPEQFVERIHYLYAHPDVTSHDEIELIDGTILERFSTSVWDWIGKYYGRIWQYRDVTAERRAERALEQKEYYQRALLDNIPHAIWLKDRDSRFLTVNQEFALVFCADSPEALVGKNDFDIAPPELAEGYRADDRRVQASREKLNVEEEIVDRGVRKWFETYKAPVIDERGQLLGTVGFARDISERKKTEENLRLAALVYENSSEAMVVTNADNLILSVNPAFTAMTGYSADEVIGKNPRILRSGEHDAAFYRSMWQALTTTGNWRGEIKNRRKNGELFVEELTINTIYNANGQPQRRVALFSDITQRKQSEKQIWRQANFDPLTGLPNRRMFRDRLEQEMKKAHRMGQSFALLFIDLDRFKEVNDTLGHEIGDMLLKETAHRLQTCVRESDTVARLGGDEFTIILSELDSIGSSERIAKSLLQKLRAPFSFGDELAYVSASIGITLYPDDSTSLSQLLKNADQAMYAAKNQGRNGYNFFTKALQDALKARAAMLADLRSALADNQFLLYYQPIVDLGNGSIQKAEALLRWSHPNRGLISPTEFVPLAEETGLINDIGDWVFRSAVRQARLWRAAIHPEFQISINKSPVQFQNANHSPTQWFEYLQEMDLSGQSIVVEITEGLLLDANLAVRDHLMAFRDAGIQVAIDDFGTGYSALSYLKKFDIDYLKIDQSFVRNLSPDSSDFVLCEAIIVMAHKLGLKVIAEGVETELQRDLLSAIGCDYGQGYLFAEPLPAEMFEQRFGHSGK